MRRIIHLVLWKEKKKYVISDAAVAKNLFMNTYAFIYMTLNEAEHLITHWHSQMEIWASTWKTDIQLSDKKTKTIKLPH